MVSIEKHPLVSIIIPAFNNKKWLIEAIHSVFRQTYKNWEIIVDDESDKAEEVAADIPEVNDKRITYLRTPNGGIGFSRNIGISHAKGKYVALLDSDDFWEVDKLEIQVEAMEQAGAVWSQHNYYYYIDETHERSKIINTYKYRNCIPRIVFLSFKVQSSSFMFLRETLINEKLSYDESDKYGPGEEWPVYVGLSKKYKLLCIDKPLTNFRIRAKNSGFNVRSQIYGRKKVWDAYKTDPYFLLNTNILSRAAYRICVFGNALSNKLKLSDYSLMAKIIYAVPWLLFKLCTQYEIIKSSKSDG